ncbi:threonine aldolase family protein [Clostridium sp. C105KSO13]|uniref:threonine aldolase family protein n=1 Tax=Clostridium sp. C105KSO13 TaxID=1776045 RepID=UPI0007406B48|nr:low specificity L-threonine aldolase [Clostridium sp. C105KSO13]CUX47589.1 Low specificity L-threonine aldolase [Clostridium sp. C105KSO13]
MLYFNCDYNEGAHPQVLDRLCETNMEQTSGYGEDSYCERAREVIRGLCGNDKLGVHFLVGGTQANLTVIAAALRSHQGVLAAESGHIHVHETGAIEACGHKVLTVPSENGKIAARQVEEVYRSHVEDESFEHTVQPKMVYISNPTELGTIYSKVELEELSAVCKRNDLYLFMDGARLGYGLTAEGNDLDLKTISKLCDVFYIGGTKVGALFGEAVVIANPVLQKDFRYIIKQKGGMLAKGRLLGIQFLALLENGLYFELGKRANGMADKIRLACRKAGYLLLIENTTNQIFVVMPDSKLDKLREKYAFSYQQRIDESHSAVRFCTSWATMEENVQKLAEDIL